MIPNELLQKGIVAKLKADAALTAYLAPSGSASVLENQYQGQDFVYPAIRVDILPQQPIGNGTDRLRISSCIFTVRAYSAKSSSYEANHLATLVGQALFNKQIDGTDESSQANFRLLRINILNIDGAFRISDRLWMATATFDSEGNIISPP